MMGLRTLQLDRQFATCEMQRALSQEASRYWPQHAQQAWLQPATRGALTCGASPIHSGGCCCRPAVRRTMKTSSHALPEHRQTHVLATAAAHATTSRKLNCTIGAKHCSTHVCVAEGCHFLDVRPRSKRLVACREDGWADGALGHRARKLEKPSAQASTQRSSRNRQVQGRLSWRQLAELRTARVPNGPSGASQCLPEPVTMMTLALGWLRSRNRQADMSSRITCGRQYQTAFGYTACSALWLARRVCCANSCMLIGGRQCGRGMDGDARASLFVVQQGGRPACRQQQFICRLRLHPKHACMLKPCRKVTAPAAGGSPAAPACSAHSGPLAVPL